MGPAAPAVAGRARRPGVDRPDHGRRATRRHSQRAAVDRRHRHPARGRGRGRSTGGSPSGGSTAASCRSTLGCSAASRSRVPLTRIQGIDLVRPLLARMLGVSELRLVLAGHDTDSARLAYLSEDRAIVRTRRAAWRSPTASHDDTPEPAERPILAVRGGQILAANLLSSRFVVRRCSCSAAVVAAAVFEPHAVAGILGTALFILAADLLVTGPADLGRVGVPHRRGAGRPAAAQRPVADPRGDDPARPGPGGALGRAAVVAAVRLGPARGRRRPAAQRRPRRTAVRRDVARAAPGRVTRRRRAGCSAGSCRARSPSSPVAEGVPAAGVLARTAGDGGSRGCTTTRAYIACCTGRFRPDTVVVPLEKIQSIRWSQGPWSRRLRLANIHIDTAGQRFTATGAAPRRRSRPSS